MGGTAFVIHGEVESWRLGPVPVKKSLFDRLLWRQRYDNPTYNDDGFETFVTVPAPNLERLGITAFRDFLKKRMPTPWEATKWVLDYLDTAMSIRLRGNKPKDTSEVDWYIQIGFSGCAGMADVSADLGYHWAYLWLQSELVQITNTIFGPEGFVPNTVLESFIDVVGFVPVGYWGYAGYTTASESAGDGSFVSIDGGWMDALEDRAEERMGDLLKIVAPMMADSKCRCQLCMPQFDSNTIEGRGFGN